MKEHHFDSMRLSSESHLQAVHDDSKTPNITHLGVVMPVKDDLWGHVEQCATLIVHDIYFTTRKTLHIAQSKICYLKRRKNYYYM